MSGLNYPTMAKAIVIQPVLERLGVSALIEPLTKDPETQATWDAVLAKGISKGERVALEFLYHHMWGGEPRQGVFDVGQQCDADLATLVLDAANHIVVLEAI